MSIKVRKSGVGEYDVTLRQNRHSLITVTNDRAFVQYSFLNATVQNKVLIKAIIFLRKFCLHHQNNYHQHCNNCLIHFPPKSQLQQNKAKS